MAKIDTNGWKEFSLLSLGFSNYHGQRLNKSQRIDGSLPFVTAGKENRGVTKYIGNKRDTYVFPITVDMFGNCFYHPYECAGDDNVYFFVNDKLSANIKLFISVSINAETSRKFAYIDQFRQPDADSLSVYLPVDKEGNPDFAYMDKYMMKVMQQSKGYLKDLGKCSIQRTVVDISCWEEYRIGDLFEKCDLKVLKPDFNKVLDVSEERTVEFDLPLVNAKHGNNGIMFYGRECDFESAEMTIDIVQNGAIATGDVYYQPQKTGVLWDAYLVNPIKPVAQPKALMFVASVMKRTIKGKFSYDDKCVWDKVNKLNIKLPSLSSGEPDWEYMDNYMAKVMNESKTMLEQLRI